MPPFVNLLPVCGVGALARLLIDQPSTPRLASIAALHTNKISNKWRLSE